MHRQLQLGRRQRCYVQRFDPDLYHLDEPRTDTCANDIRADRDGQPDVVANNPGAEYSYAVTGPYARPDASADSPSVRLGASASGIGVLGLLLWQPGELRCCRVRSALRGRWGVWHESRAEQLRRLGHLQEGVPTATHVYTNDAQANQRTDYVCADRLRPTYACTNTRANVCSDASSDA